MGITRQFMFHDYLCAGNITLYADSLTIAANNVTKTYGAALKGYERLNSLHGIGMQNRETIGSGTNHILWHRISSKHSSKNPIPGG